MTSGHIYRALHATGLMERSRTMRGMFRFAYFRYKRFVEDPFRELTRDFPQLFENGHIIDVGANLGYTADVFARVAGDGWKVIAFEPDATNFAAMAAAKPNIVAVPVAVGSTSGQSRLWLNRSSHADHRIMTDYFSRTINVDETAPVEVTSIDDYLAGSAEFGSDARVSFCKIDVQGYESEVLRGMRRTIESNPDMTLAVEYCPWIIRELGLDESAFFDELNRHGFKCYLLRRRQPLSEVMPEQLRQIVGPQGYADIVCTHRTIRTLAHSEKTTRPADKTTRLDLAARV